METNQPIPAATNVTITKRSPFGAGSVSFLLGVLLFLMPFVNITCSGSTIKEVKGFELAAGFSIDDKRTSQSLLGGFGNDQLSQNSKAEKRGPDIFALAALGLGIIGLIISFLAKGRSVAAAFTGGLASVALIAFMINIKGDPQLNTSSNNALEGLGYNLGNEIIKVEFTPWIYLTIILFLAGAFFSWRKQSKPAESIPVSAPPAVEEEPLGNA